MLYHVASLNNSIKLFNPVPVHDRSKNQSLILKYNCLLLVNYIFLNKIFRENLLKTRDDLMEKHVNRNKLIILWILIAVLIVAIGLIGASSFDWFLMAWTPISFLLAIGFQALSHHFMEEKYICPECGGLNELEAIKCEHCGFEFVQQCPKCGYFNPFDYEKCEKCGTNSKAT